TPRPQRTRFPAYPSKWTLKEASVHPTSSAHRIHGTRARNKAYFSRPSKGFRNVPSMGMAGLEREQDVDKKQKALLHSPEGHAEGLTMKTVCGGLCLASAAQPAEG